VRTKKDRRRSDSSRAACPRVAGAGPPDPNCGLGFRRLRSRSSGRAVGQPRASWRVSCSALIPAVTEKIDQALRPVKGRDEKNTALHVAALSRGAFRSCCAGCRHPGSSRRLLAMAMDGDLGEDTRVHLLCGPKLKRQPRSNRTVRGESPRRGGGPPLSVGSVGRAERLLPGLQARGPSPRTKGSGERSPKFRTP